MPVEKMMPNSAMLTFGCGSPESGMLVKKLRRILDSRFSTPLLEAAQASNLHYLS